MYKRESLLGSQFQRVRVHKHHGEEHHSRLGCIAFQQLLSTYILIHRHDTERASHMGMAQAFEISKSTTSDIPSVRLHLLTLSEQFQYMILQRLISFKPLQLFKKLFLFPVGQQVFILQRTFDKCCGIKGKHINLQRNPGVFIKCCVKFHPRNSYETPVHDNHYALSKLFRWHLMIRNNLWCSCYLHTNTHMETCVNLLTISPTFSFQQEGENDFHLVH